MWLSSFGVQVSAGLVLGIIVGLVALALGGRAGIQSRRADQTGAG